MNYTKKLALLPLIILCIIVTECESENNKQGFLLGPSLLSQNQLVANAGADQNAYSYSGTINLDGSGSYDSEGKVLTFYWEIVYQPDGSTAVFNDNTLIAPSFFFNAVGTYEIRLTINNGRRSSSDLVTVNVADNRGPMADAGENRDVTIGETVTLDGSGSSDPDGDTLVYSWTQILGPTIGNGSLTGVNPTFTAPSDVCTIAFDLRVNDGEGNSLSSRVYIYVMKKAGAGIFVAIGGNDANEGIDRSRPKRTIPAAIIAAGAAGSDVYVSAGVYEGSLTLASGVSLFGGFDPSIWVRDSFKSSVTPSYTTAIQGGTIIDSDTGQSEYIAIDGKNINNIYIDGFTISGENAADFGKSSYSLRLKNSTVELKNSFISAGNGYAGEDGTPGATGSAGADGNAGQRGYADDLTSAAGGPGGSGSATSNNHGGNGGDGGTGEFWDSKWDGQNGTYGHIAESDVTPGGSGGEAGGSDCINVLAWAWCQGVDGQKGSTGANGQTGANVEGGSSGAVTNNIWVSTSGQAGLEGSPGYGGGGGGGGGTQTRGNMVLELMFADGTGNAGGGGGAGGEGGKGGNGGHGGGGSFGVFLIDSIVIIKNCTITSGYGGSGGKGGDGGYGGNGGRGGDGPDYNTDEVGAGGDGGGGGAGGGGSAGGGGAGGPSFAIYKHGWTSGITLTGSTLNCGNGGAGGAAGTAGLTGAAGAGDTGATGAGGASTGNPGAAGASGYYGGN
ncbi:MAG: hypothetical protein KA369_17775 [Spirochaetes bacterium]|nr:hypothetical protein [Spirochaetota bacterium]